MDAASPRILCSTIVWRGHRDTTCIKKKIKQKTKNCPGQRMGHGNQPVCCRYKQYHGCMELEVIPEKLLRTSRFYGFDKTEVIIPRHIPRNTYYHQYSNIGVENHHLIPWRNWRMNHTKNIDYYLMLSMLLSSEAITLEGF